MYTKRAMILSIYYSYKPDPLLSLTTSKGSLQKGTGEVKIASKP
jgi:hypothetical protein